MKEPHPRPTHRVRILRTIFCCATVLALLAGRVFAAADANFVVIITVDGLRSTIFSELSAAQLPNYTRVRSEGVTTLNARTDYDWTYTNPNHVSILSARRVITSIGHNYISTGSPPVGATLHSVAGFYVTSIFDIAHDRGHRTGVYITKGGQLSIVNSSYDATRGALDVTGSDNGRDKIDSYYALDYQSDSVTTRLLADMAAQPFHLTWLHWAEPDQMGHSYDWNSTAYRQAIIATDTQLGRIINAINASPVLRGRTTLIITTDHGGTLNHHFDAAVATNYTIPFFVWGAGVKRAGDLYFINRPFRQDPGVARISYAGATAAQPIRNIDAGNLALKLLGLPAIPDNGAFVNQAQDLRVALPTFEVSSLQFESGGLQLSWLSLGNGYGYTVQARASLSDLWENTPGPWPTTATTWLDPSPGLESRFYRVVASALPAAAPAASTDFAAPARKPRRYSGLLEDDGITGQPLRLPSTGFTK